jgi:hypothetical protein
MNVLINDGLKNPGSRETTAEEGRPLFLRATGENLQPGPKLNR